MSSVTVIQSRTSSSRLPAKALLPIGAMPMAVLAARRAANTGRQVIVATSEDASDDQLAEIFAKHGLNCFRGKLDDPLGRFVAALSDLPDQTKVIRLTADNVLPDGEFLDRLEAEFDRRKLKYLTTGGPDTGLPYGVSAEIFFLGDLRVADREAREPADREHVTPFIIRKYGSTACQQFRDLKLQHYRSTVDNFEDYLEILRVFANLSDPIGERWEELAKRLTGGPHQAITDSLAPKMILGTAQIGMPYGIANCSQLSDSESIALIRFAISNGVGGIDTAHAYGKSEEIIGKALVGGWADRVTVFTKLSPLANIDSDTDQAKARYAVESSIMTSLYRLRLQQLDTVLLHRASHLTQANGAIWSRLCDFREQEIIRRLGVSVQSPDELMSAIEFDGVGHVQLPFNILDHRWTAAIERLRAVRQHKSLTVHVRSVFLQGLLLHDDITKWKTALVENGDEIQSWLVKVAKDYGRRDIADLAVAFVNGQDWVDGIVLGNDNLSQLKENIALVNKPMLDDGAIDRVVRTGPRLSDESLNPVNWKKV